MSMCATCGNEYDRSFDVVLDGTPYSFDCFECAIHKLAPVCGGCGCRIVGHGVQAADELFCGAHCARERGVRGLTTHVPARGSGAVP